MYEKLKEKPISRSQFYKRLFSHFLVLALIVLVSLIVGVLGFMYFENASLHMAFLNSSLLLAGLGLIEKPVTPVGHWFVGFYGLYAGLIFIISLGILITPAIHRVIHTLHWSDDNLGD